MAVPLFENLQQASVLMAAINQGRHEKSQAIHLFLNASKAVELAKPISCILEVWWAAPDALYQELASAGLRWSLEEVSLEMKNVPELQLLKDFQARIRSSDAVAVTHRTD